MTQIVFLGILLDGTWLILALPLEKVQKATQYLLSIVGKRKATVHEVQKLTGLLNFLNRAIYLGRVFTRRMYAKITSKMVILKQYHHINLDREFKSDCKMWLAFLQYSESNSEVLCRPFLDLSLTQVARDIGFFTDSSANPELGFEGIYQNEWFFGKWEPGYMNKDENKPSIEYLSYMLFVLGYSFGCDTSRT